MRFAVEVDYIAVVIPRGARKAHFRSRDIGDPALPHHLGYEELDLVVSLQSTNIDRADLNVVLVVLPSCTTPAWPQACESGRGWPAIPKKFCSMRV